ncbi:Fungalysin metallopeptidase-domain-containing protein [Auriculariales sp. MPI-PUGE-AT-0066]|nr:Fungalysin metallopeptidase-domain-containing protein [Auriculariales sp. MPI-PUGE-AT-0066]
MTLSGSQSTSQLTAGFASASKHSTHRTRSLPNGASVTTYHPKTNFEVYERGIPRRDVGTFQKSDFRSASVQFIHSKHGKPDDNEDKIEVLSSYQGPHSSLVWVRQTVGGIPVANTMANVAMNSKGDVVSYGSSLVPVKKSKVSKAGFVKTSKLTGNAAIHHAYNVVGGKVDSKRPPTLAYLADENGDLKLTHCVRMHLPNNHVYDAYVDAVSGDVRVTNKDIGEAGQVLLSDVEDLAVSPHGWTAAPGGSLPAGVTLGNNVVAAFVGNLTSLASPVDAFVQNVVPMSSDGVFDYPANLKADPTTVGNRAAAVVHAFYAANMAHDILYRCEHALLLCDQPGGQAMDPVLVSVQDTGMENNALFTTLPDGQASYLQTFLFNLTLPDLERDSTLDNTVILHEYAHGLTNRMTGGGTAVCLQTLESAGMGEGWSDAFAEWVWQSAQSTFSDFTVGDYTSGYPLGLRTYPYSVNRTTNPLTYGDVPKFDEVHLIGEVWAQTLHVVHANLVAEFGSATDALTNPDGENGHAVFLRVMVDALRIQPCNPTFAAARLAIIQGEENRYAGKYMCNLWISFASMGLGVGAQDFVQSVKVPPECATK